MTLKYLPVVVCAGVLLSACAFNPQNSVPSTQQQCRILQRKMLFKNDFNAARNDQWGNQVQQQQLQQQFEDLHCYDVLDNARKSQPKK